MKKRLPKFKTLDEAGEFWYTHDFSDYWDAMKEVYLTMAGMTVTLDDKYVKALAPLGDVRASVDEAIRRYTVERITSIIADLQAKDARWREKYGCDYETFVARSAKGKKFIKDIEKFCKTWEEDLAEWEFCHEGIQDWYRHLQETLLN